MSANNEQILKPCPFCGGDAVKIQTKADNYHRERSRYRAYVRCLKCHTRGPAEFGVNEQSAASAAVDAWDFRLPDMERHL